MPSYELVTFDCYGTLIDWEGGMRASIERLALRRRVRVDAARMVSRYIQLEMGLEQGGYKPYHRILQLGLAALFRERGVALTEAESREFVRSLPRWKAFPETREVLRGLRSAGCRLAVLSNIDDALLRHSLRRIGIDFDHVVTAQRVRSYKPSPRHWQRVLAEARVPKARVLHVGASILHDVIPSTTLGLSCVWINRHRVRHSPQARPLRTFDDLRPLVPLLSGVRPH